MAVPYGLPPNLDWNQDGSGLSLHFNLHLLILFGGQRVARGGGDHEICVSYGLKDQEGDVLSARNRTPLIKGELLSIKLSPHDSYLNPGLPCLGCVTACVGEHRLRPGNVWEPCSNTCRTPASSQDGFWAAFHERPGKSRFRVGGCIGWLSWLNHSLEEAL